MTIDGRDVPFDPGKSVLEVAQNEGIYIPRLCYHPGLSPFGACRLCIVEVKKSGRPGLTASCTLPATDGLVVETSSVSVLKARQMLIKLLLAAAPDSEVVWSLAEKLGVETHPFRKTEDEDKKTRDKKCILCGLCVRVCEQMGSSAIGFAFRGPHRRVIPPFEKPPDECLGCRACENICPTGAISFSVEGGALLGQPWGAKLNLKVCSACGKPFLPERLLEKVKPMVEMESIFELCPNCRRRRMMELVK